MTNTEGTPDERDASLLVADNTDGDFSFPDTQNRKKLKMLSDNDQNENLAEALRVLNERCDGSELAEQALSQIRDMLGLARGEPSVAATCSTCKYAVVQSIDAYAGDPAVPDYPLTCELSSSESGSPTHSSALACAFDSEVNFAKLYVKTTYSCPQHLPSKDPKLVTYRHHSTTHEQFQQFQQMSNQGDVEILKRNYKVSGKEMSAEELCAAFEARFATGAQLVPNPLRQPCPGWSDETGCPGHIIPVGTKPA